MGAGSSGASAAWVGFGSARLPANLTPTHMTSATAKTIPPIFPLDMFAPRKWTGGAVDRRNFRPDLASIDGIRGVVECRGRLHRPGCAWAANAEAAHM